MKWIESVIQEPVRSPAVFLDSLFRSYEDGSLNHGYFELLLQDISLKEYGDSMHDASDDRTHELFGLHATVNSPAPFVNSRATATTG